MKKATKRVWTTHELSYLRQAHAKGVTHRTMAEKLGRTKNAVSNCISQKIIHGKIVAANLPGTSTTTGKEFTVSLPVSVEEFKLEGGMLTIRLKGN